jgi:hypothetical protein
MIMAVVAAGALKSAGNERRSAQGTRDAAAAFYAAEGGMHQVWANWPDSLVETLMPGDSLDLGWQTLEDGSKYQAKIFRYDAGDQRMYDLSVEGRGAGPAGGQRLLKLLVTSERLKLGACCGAAATVDGPTDLTHLGTRLSGFDVAPPGWEAAGECPTPDDDVVGLNIKEDAELTKDGSALLDGTPPLVEDTTINESTFSQFGPNLTWSQLKALADHTLGDWSAGAEQVFIPSPSYLANGKCDTSDPLNWGSSIPGDPCFDYWPIVLLKGDVAIQSGYGHALVILDWNEMTFIGTELDLEFGMRLDGIILGKGCIEIQGGSVMHGSVFADGNFFNADLCAGDKVLDMNNDSEGGSGPGVLDWSRCVVDKVLTATGVEPFITASGYSVLSPRGFSEAIR